MSEHKYSKQTVTNFLSYTAKNNYIVFPDNVWVDDFGNEFTAEELFDKYIEEEEPL